MLESVTIYPYSSTTLSTATKTITYNYGSETDTTTDDDGTGWNKILLGVDLNGNGTIEDNEEISYDSIGNPNSYFGNTLKWTGRELYRYQSDSFQNNYYYDSEGLRSRKNIYTKNESGSFEYAGKTMYQYLGGLLSYQCTYNAAGEAEQELYFYYDSYNKLTAIRYISKDDKIDCYFYVTTNSQGDVLGIYTSAGALRASYEYDAWGNATVYAVSQNAETGKDEYTKITNQATSGNIGAINPIRYRGYYYDTDLELYYLQSRYYDATIGRFLNADGLLNGNGDVLGFNMYAYCSNNPVIFSDENGYGKVWDWIKSVFGIKNKASTSSKQQKCIKGTSALVKYSSGTVTDVSISSHSDKSSYVYTEAQYNSDGITNMVGVTTNSSSFAGQYSTNDGLGYSISTNNKYLSGSFEYSKSVDYTSISIKKYTTIEDSSIGAEISYGNYYDIQINNNAIRFAKVVTACVAVSVAVPASAPISIGVIKIASKLCEV